MMHGGQMARQGAVNAKIAGSSPARAANFDKFKGFVGKMAFENAPGWDFLIW